MTFVTIRRIRLDDCTDESVRINSVMTLNAEGIFHVDAVTAGKSSVIDFVPFDFPMCHETCIISSWQTADVTPTGATE